MDIHIRVYHTETTPTFFAGSKIEGVVVVNFNGNENIRGVKLKIRGKEHTSWDETESTYNSSENKDETRTVTYTGDNKIIYHNIVLIAGSKIEPGQRELPFSYVLPKNCPDTFKGYNGRIWYYLKAVIDIPWASNLEALLNFTVKSPIDFNERPGLNMNPVQYVDEMDKCCGCCASEPITMVLKMDKEAFVVGETMTLKIDITNMANANVTRLTAKLKMKVKEKVTSPRSKSKCYTELIANFFDNKGVGAHGHKTYNVYLKIPFDAKVPNLDMSTLFEKWYKLEIEADISGCHGNPKIKTGIMLGHIPLQGQGNIRNENIERQYGSSAPVVPIEPPPYEPSSLYPPEGNVGKSEIPQVHMPFPYGNRSGALLTVPESTPSAPPKSLISKAGVDDEWEDLEETEPPPPDYNEAVKKT